MTTAMSLLNIMRNELTTSGEADRIALEKCTQLYDDTQGTLKHKRFRQRVFVRCKKRQKMIKEEGSKEEDKELK